MSELTTINTPSDLLAVAINKDADIDKLEKLMQLQERYDAKQAEREFNLALSRFQKECPVIKKSKEGFGYKYADLDAIVRTIKDTLFECGLSFRFEQKQDNGIHVKCILSHIDGHHQSSEMTASADDSGRKNVIQAIGSAVTYLKRYTLVDVLGLATSDEDVDGRQPNDISPDVLYDMLLEYNKLVRANFDTITNIKTAIANDNPGDAIMEWRDLEQEVQKALWVAPSNGGIFTTEERAALKKTSEAENKKDAA